MLKLNSSENMEFYTDKLLSTGSLISNMSLARLAVSHNVKVDKKYQPIVNTLKTQNQ